MMNDERLPSEPLLPVILQELGQKNALVIDPSFFVGENSDSNDTHKDTTIHNKFWLEALVQSCLRHSSLTSSIETTYNDALLLNLSKDGYNYARHLDFIRGVLCSAQVCCTVSRDGSVIGNKEQPYRIAHCTRNKEGNASLPSVNDEQIDSLATLAAANLTGVIAHFDATNGEHAAQSEVNRGWFTNPFSIARQGFNYAMDKLVDAYDSQDYPVNNEFEGEEDDDNAMSASCNYYDVQNDDDDASVGGRGINRGGGSNQLEYDIGSTDEMVSLSVVASTCQLLLEYANGPSEIEHETTTDCTFYIVRSGQGQVERVLMYRNSVGASFMEFCKQAGRYFTAREKGDHKSRRIGIILAHVSEKEMQLLVTTLHKLNHALVEGEVVTLFPGVIPNNYETSKTDEALFQIHTTKQAVQCRIQQLQNDANHAKQQAVKTNRNKTIKLALVHMRRRKAALDEIDRCATILLNLDTSELSLERAKSDAQLIQTYAVLKTALAGVRKDFGIDNDDVSELMNVIREETEMTNENTVYIEKDELNEEFRLLEQECEKEETRYGGGDRLLETYGSKIEEVVDERTRQTAEEGSMIQSVETTRLKSRIVSPIG